MGCRPDAITAGDTPTLHRLRVEGVDFANSHAVFPTVTRVNAATLATGTQPGTHGITGNQIFVPEVDPSRALDTAAYRRLLEVDRATGGRLVLTRTLAERLEARWSPSGRGQLGLDGQRLADEPKGAGGGRGARQRLPRSGPARGVAGRRERGDPRQVRARAAEGPRGRASRCGGDVDPAGAARVRAAGAGPGRRDQLGHRARPHAAHPGCGVAGRARGAPARRPRDRAGTGCPRRPRPGRVDRHLRRVGPRLHHQYGRCRRRARSDRRGAQGRPGFRRRGPGEQWAGGRAARGGAEPRTDRTHRALRPVARLGRRALHRRPGGGRPARRCRRHVLAGRDPRGERRPRARPAGDVSVDLGGECVRRAGDRSRVCQRRRDPLRQRSRRHEPVERAQYARGVGRRLQEGRDA